MDVDWKLLVRVREQQRSRAQQRVAREREVAAAAVAQARALREAWLREVEARSDVWSSLAGRPEALDIALMRQASAWSRTLDGRVRESAQHAQQARDAALQKQQHLEACRRQLRNAAGELQKAEQMHERVRRDAQRVAQSRGDEQLEETAVQTWASRRPPR
jgi:hypothetical protein